MKVIYPGTFNLWHIGHQYVFDQACKMFGKDNVYIGIAVNPTKKDSEANQQFIKWTLNPITKNVITIEGLVVDQKVNDKPFDFIIRGVRSNQDVDYELNMSDWNSDLGIKTIFIPCPGYLRHISSSSIRLLAKHGKSAIGPYIAGSSGWHSYTRWNCYKLPQTIIYFGKISIGKSTYIKSQHGDAYIDLDKEIWKGMSDDQVSFFKTKFYLAIKTSDIQLYQNTMAELNTYLDWSVIFKYNGVYEASALGMWWDYIPKEYLLHNKLIKLHTPDEIRKHRLEKRGLFDKVNCFDFFYTDPPFWDEEVMI